MRKPEHKYLVGAADSPETILNHGFDVEYACDTLAEAKEKARYITSRQYHLTAETYQQYKYAQVRLNSFGLFRDMTVVWDFFAKP